MPLPVAARRKAGLTLRDMARHLRMSHVYLWDLEEGHRPLRPEVLARYRAGLRKLARKPRKVA